MQCTSEKLLLILSSLRTNALVTEKTEDKRFFIKGFLSTRKGVGFSDPLFFLILLSQKNHFHVTEELNVLFSFSTKTILTLYWVEESVVPCRTVCCTVLCCTFLYNIAY